MSRLSLETHQLVRFLQQRHAENTIATYDELSEVLQNDIQKKRSNLSSALKICLRDYGLNFEVVTGRGYVPIAKEKIGVIATEDAQRKIRSANTKWRDRLQSVDVTGLQGDSLHKHVSGYLKLELSERLVSPETNKAIESQVAQTHMTGKAGLEYARAAAIALLHIS